MVQGAELTLRSLTVLLVEETAGESSSVRRALGVSGSHELEIEAAAELRQALKRLSKGGIDVVLLDLALPDSHGMSTFERTRAFAQDVPIVVLVERDEDALAMSAVQAGAQDAIAKPDVSSGLVLRSLRYAVERHRFLTAMSSLSLIDDLTGLYNRRACTDLAEQYLKLARRSKRGVTLVYLDIDRLKTINDSLGLPSGDRALMKVAEILRATFRRSDVIARMGDDEFVVMALEASGEDARALAERLKTHVAEFNGSNREPYQLSLSIGVVRDDATIRVPVEHLLREAEEVMYEHKRSRRRTVSR